MIFMGRELDVLGLWSEFIDIPNGVSMPLPTYLPKVICPNPDHDTHKRHFQVNARQPLVHCFANCGISGTYEHAVATILGITEKEARRHILKHSRAWSGKAVDLSAFSGKRKTIASDDPVARDQRQLDGGAFTYLPKEVRAWLDSRGIDQPSRGKWQIGYDEESERIVIPAYDERSRFSFLIKRSIRHSGHLKYLYTEGSIKTSLLFGACMVDETLVDSQGLILCEGSLDVIRLHGMGARNAVGVLGTGISKRQVRLIDKFNPQRIYLMFDKDAAGVDNIRSVGRWVTKVPLFVCRYPAGKNDPAELEREEVRRSIERALPMHQFLRLARNVA